jgi:glycosyltransferase involved in cell wall biosynthesis
VEVPNGVDLDIFREGADTRVVREALRIAPGVPLLLFVAALDRAHHFKGLGRLLEAMQEVRHAGIQLLVVGDGDQRSQYEAWVDERGLRPFVHFAGAVPHAQLPPYVAAADLLVLPTSPPESFGMVLIEAMACGKPVIASDIPGVRSVVRSTGGGMLVPPDDVPALAAAIVECATDPRRLKALGTAGRRAVEAGYSWPLIAKRLDRLYQALPGTKAAHPAVVRSTPGF